MLPIQPGGLFPMCAYPVPAFEETLLRSFLTYQRTHCAPKQTNGTLLWHFTELDYVSAFLRLWLL